LSFDVTVLANHGRKEFFSHPLGGMAIIRDRWSGVAARHDLPLIASFVSESNDLRLRGAQLEQLEHEISRLRDLWDRDPDVAAGVVSGSLGEVPMMSHLLDRSDRLLEAVAIARHADGEVWITG
jgi:hypothetical protein